MLCGFDLAQYPLKPYKKKEALTPPSFIYDYANT